MRESQLGRCDKPPLTPSLWCWGEDGLSLPRCPVPGCGFLSGRAEVQLRCQGRMPQRRPCRCCEQAGPAPLLRRAGRSWEDAAQTAAARSWPALRRLGRSLGNTGRQLLLPASPCEAGAAALNQSINHALQCGFVLIP